MIQKQGPCDCLGAHSGIFVKMSALCSAMRTLYVIVTGSTA